MTRGEIHPVVARNEQALQPLTLKVDSRDEAAVVHDGSDSTTLMKRAPYSFERSVCPTARQEAGIAVELADAPTFYYGVSF